MHPLSPYCCPQGSCAAAPRPQRRIPLALALPPTSHQRRREPQSGSKRILGKASPVYALQVHDGLLYTGSTPSSSSSSMDSGGAPIKVWSCANYGLVGSMVTAAEARSLVVSADLVYVASRNAAVEILFKEKLARISTLQVGRPGCHVQCMAVDGTSDGKIQAWGLT